MGQHRPKLTMYTPAVFRIRVQGGLDESWSSHFGTRAMRVEEDETGCPVTIFTSEPVDQAALVGLISHLSALGLPLMSVDYLSTE